MRVPRWNFVAVTRPCDAQRIYVRVKSNEQCEIKRNVHSISNLLSVPFSQIKAEAEKIVRFKDTYYIIFKLIIIFLINILRI